MTAHMASLVSRARGARADIQPVATVVHGRVIEPVGDEAYTASARADRHAAQPPDRPRRATESAPPEAPARRSGAPRAATSGNAPVRWEKAPADRPGKPVADEPPARAEFPAGDAAPTAPGEAPPDARGTPPTRASRRPPDAAEEVSGGFERDTAGEEGSEPAPIQRRLSAHGEPEPPPAPARTSSESAATNTHRRAPSRQTPSESRALAERTPVAAASPEQTPSSILSRRRGGRLEAIAARRAVTGQPSPGEGAPPSVHIAIGRVEVRAVQPPPAAAPPRPAEPARPSQSLDDYLRERDRSVGA